MCRGSRVPKVGGCHASRQATRPRDMQQPPNLPGQRPSLLTSGSTHISPIWRQITLGRLVPETICPADDSAPAR
jgi:hypothetical protein